MNGGIYKILNTVDGKQYVGSAVNLNKRKSEHWSGLRTGIHHNPHLQNAWNKYGEDAFEFRVVGKCPPERLIELEQEVMDHLKPEYNLTPTAGSSLGLAQSIETRRKISDTLKGRKVSEETKQKIREAQIGRRHTEESKQKMSKSQKGHRVSSETRQKIGKIHLGKNPSEETRRKTSEAVKEYHRKKKMKINESINKGGII